MSHTPEPEFLQAPPSDRWWAIISLSVLAIVSIWAGVICYRLLKVAPPPVAAVNHGPLPAEVRTKALALLNANLKDTKLEERWEGADRDFLIMGTPKPELAKAFSVPFRASVSTDLMPLLRPYGETLSFQIYNFDFAPVRLRPLPQELPFPPKD